MRRCVRFLAFFSFVLLLFGSADSVRGQAPAEVQGVVFGDEASLSWTPVGTADFYHAYRGTISGLATNDPARCHGFEIPGTTFSTPANPANGEGYFYLVTAESIAGGEGTPGSPSLGGARALLGRCGPVMRDHLLDRLGYGWNEWTRDRVASLGFAGYIAEQLTPSAIDESTNTELNARLGPWDPPTDIFMLIGRRVVSAVYARRQLEQQVAAFWANHFNTWWQKVADVYLGAYPDCSTALPQCDPNYPTVAYLEATLALHRELEDFRYLGFNGNFREILEATALSPAMILYLDAYTSVAGNPNENYPRELLELYALGVDGGYTQFDVEELSRIFTGLTICEKKTNIIDDLVAPCTPNYWEAIPPGEWTAHFVPANHDCTQKVLFAGEPEQAIIPDTCGNPPDGINDLSLALDAIAAHPSTARFISTKLLKRFVTDNPTQPMIDALVAEWNDGTNPHGVGDLRAVLEAALAMGEFLDPDLARGKIKTPLEQFASALRATRGTTDGLTLILDSLIQAQHIPHFQPVPTGFPEDGGFWLDTTNTLERQNFGINLAAFNLPEFGSDPIALLNDNAVSTAPGNSAPIVDFFSDAFFGGAITPAERQEAIDFLDTDDAGTPSPYNDDRIRDLVAFLLGHAQFQEQ